MQRTRLAMVTGAFSLVLLSSSSAQSGPYPFGDAPYRLNWGPDPAIESGCLKWNWQQHHWSDHCPRYFNPKAYMYPRSPRVVLRTKG